MRAQIAAALLAALLPPGSAFAQSTGFAFDVRAGASFESETLGHTTGVPDGYFNLRDVEAAPTIGAGILFPATILGIRPQARVSYALPADVGGTWIPCDPGLACPSILLPVAGRASRLEATVGAELPVLAPAGPARPYASVGVGIRRFGLSWSQVGEFPEGINLEAGSFGETDFLARLGLGVGLRRGPYEAIIEGTADFSSFGPGRVPVPAEALALWPEPTIDLGRESLREYEVSVGLRRYLD